MKLILAITACSALVLVASNPVPQVEGNPLPVDSPHDFTWPIKGKCQKVYCLDVIGRGPCLSNCCRESRFYTTPSPGRSP